MFTRENILLIDSCNSKDELLSNIAKFAKTLDITNDEAQLLADLKGREAEASTGFTDGVAIPHAQSSAVLKPSIVVVKVAEGFDYQSMDGKPSDLFISILVPKDSGDQHLKILQKLSRSLARPDYIDEIKAAKTEDQLFTTINQPLTEGEEAEVTSTKLEQSGKHIVAVCACPMGLAHTFMAAEVIETYAKENGHTYKIETQGADGIQNYIEPEDVAAADVIIHAIAVTPQDNDRFEDCIINEVGLQDLIKNPKQYMDSFMENENVKSADAQALIDKAAKQNKQNIKSNENKTWAEISKHLMSGISYMIPVLVMGGLLGALALLIPYIFLGVDPDSSIELAMASGAYTGASYTVLKFCYVLQGFGFTLFGFAIPVFAAFCANSIGGKSAWPIGFIGGYVAINPVAHAVLQSGEVVPVTPVASGFMGAVVIAFFAGYFVKFLNRKIKVSHNLLAFKTTFLIPLLSAIATMILMVYVITPIGGGINLVFEQLLMAAGQAGEMAYAVLLSAATAFDLGGPVNKAAGFVALGFTTEHLLPTTARCIAIVVPSIGLGLATVLDMRLVGRRVYDPQYKQIGQTSIFLAFMGISEGAIPFALERPAFVIPVNMIGAIIGAVVAVSLGAVQWFPESAIWAWPLIDGIFPYMLGILVGSLFIALANIYWRNKLILAGKLHVSE